MEACIVDRRPDAELARPLVDASAIAMEILAVEQRMRTIQAAHDREGVDAAMRADLEKIIGRMASHIALLKRDATAASATTSRRKDEHSLSRICISLRSYLCCGRCDKDAEGEV